MSEAKKDESELNAVVMWRPMDEAPKDGTEIIGEYEDGECGIFWSDRPVCMLGTRCGGFPEGWATDGKDTDYNLPMDEPTRWKPYTQPSKHAGTEQSEAACSESP